jgi:O-antigen/teichoic acid export membrane protein
LAFNRARTINVGLRSSILGIRFFFVFFLAKYLDVDAVGYYGIFTATIGYSLYFVGLDFYVYATREIIKAPISLRGEMLKGQITLSAIIYIIVVPIALVLLNQVAWPDHLLWWFLPILLLEHFNQEVSRLLIALSEQVLASTLLFARQASWGLAAMALMQWNADSRNLNVVMALWTCAGVAAAALGYWKIRNLGFGGWSNAVNWRWVKKGVAVSSAFLLATLALRGIQTFDRYWLEALAGIEYVGIYVLFLGIAGSMMAFLDAGIFAFGYPEIIKHNHSNQYATARTKVREMLVQTIVVCLAFGVVSWLALPYLLAWIDNPVYADGKFLYPWIWAAMSLNAVGLVPHYGLYGAGYDRPIIYSHIAALPVFVLMAYTLGYFEPTLAVPIGLLVAFAFILIWKSSAYIRMVQDQSKIASPSPSHSQ